MKSQSQVEKKMNVEKKLMIEKKLLVEKKLMLRRREEQGRVEAAVAEEPELKSRRIPAQVAEYVVALELEALAELTRDKLAEHFGINRSYLSEVFKRRANRTLWEFITFERMKRAEMLLRTRPDLTVEEISRRVGIVKCEQFRAKFYRIYGLNPGKYRRTCN